MRRISAIFKILLTSLLLVFMNEPAYRTMAADNSVTSGKSTGDFNYQKQASGWIINRPYRVSLQVMTQGYTDLNKPVEYQLNFADYLHSFNINKAFDDKSLKVIETDTNGSPLDTTLVFQFDKDSNYDPQNNAAGLLIFTMNGTTNPNTLRYYQVYFDVVGKQYQLPQFSSPLSITDNVSRAGQSSYKVTANNNVQYYFQKQGAGFASILDKDGKDWINYNTNSPNEQFRGIPNLGACGHPGYPLSSDPTTLGSVSTIVSTGPLKIKIHSITTDNNWEFTWEFFQDFARMTLLKKGGNYWFLYEGVPDGNADLISGYSVRNTYARAPLSTSWTTGVLPSPKWVYFGDTRTQRVIFLAMHETDTHNDYYRPYLAQQDPTNMTVFGFGRQDPVQPNGKLLTIVPAHFTIGFVEDTTYSAVSRNILSDINSLAITKTYDAPLPPLPLVPVVVSPDNNSKNLPSAIKFSWQKSANAESYQLQVSDNAGFPTTVYDNSEIKDTTKELDIFTDGTKYFWRVCAINISGKGSFSEVRSFITALNKADNLIAQFKYPASFKLTWRNNSKAVSGFFVERKTEKENYRLIDTVKGNLNSYTDTSVVSGIVLTYRVRAFNQVALSDYSNEADGSFISSVSGKTDPAAEYSLLQNYPNPFNPSTKIEYSIPCESSVLIVIFDVTGREVVSYKYDRQNAGRYELNFNAGELTSGMYFYSLNAEASDGSKSYMQTRKMIILK